MTPEIAKVWAKVNNLRGCLSHKKQMTGRRRYENGEDPFGLSNEFVGDEAKLFSSKTWRTLARKTQVFTLPENPLVRTRTSHATEVASVSVIICDLLGLNCDLARAGAIGHDIGHVPFGHQGEHWMAKAMGRPEFRHEVMSVITAQKIERRGRGLNLTHETLTAMLNHGSNDPTEGMSQEALVLRYADKFAYIFADVNDIVTRMRYPVSAEITKLANEFGDTHRERTSTAIAGLIMETFWIGNVSFVDSELGLKFNRLKKLMYEVYPRVTQQDVAATLEPVLDFLRLLQLADPFMLLALMTDSDVLLLAKEPMKDMRAFNRTSLAEMVPWLQDIGKVDLCDPDMNW
jgi:dGTP triphosphohydrolase